MSLKASLSGFILYFHHLFLWITRNTDCSAGGPLSVALFSDAAGQVFAASNVLILWHIQECDVDVFVAFRGVLLALALV